MLPYRLKQARLRMGLSQQKLGILAGIDEATASARMNQYERGIHAPDFELVCRLANILNVPACYFYTQEDELAELVQHWESNKKYALTQLRRDRVNPFNAEDVWHADSEPQDE